MSKITNKKYKCTQCNYETTQATNHYGSTWSMGTYSACPKCPPFKKYPEYGGKTIWECMEKEPVTDKKEENGISENT
jgi:DNA-directed RNA polymerase subunit RPC12/RpoP